jgi:hypothetical protein
MALLLRFRMPDGTLVNDQYHSEKYYDNLLRRGWHAGGQGSFDDAGPEFNVVSMEEPGFEDGEYHEIIVEKIILN